MVPPRHPKEIIQYFFVNTIVTWGKLFCNIERSETEFRTAKKILNSYYAFWRRFWLLSGR